MLPAVALTAVLALMALSQLALALAHGAPWGRFARG